MDENSVIDRAQIEEIIEFEHGLEEWITFADINANMPHWQASIPKGWYGLIRDLLSEIAGVYIAAAEWNTIPYISICQVKEKFGGLRVYYNIQFEGSDRISDFTAKRMHTVADEIDEVIKKYEQLSYNVCVECGTDSYKCSDTSKTGYVAPTCKQHHEEVGGVVES